MQQQEDSARRLGAQYFSANFPPGIMQTTVVGGQDVSQRINIDEATLHKRIVTLTVSVVVPLYFMRILGFQNSTVSATGQATRRDANVMLVLDRSNSMNKNGSCAALVASAQNFASQFVEGRDQLGLVTFQTGANVDFTPTTSFKSGANNLNYVLSTLKCAGDTSTAQGLYLGYDQIKNTINQPGALNVILLFTDGQPNAVVANFAIKTSADNRYDSNNTGSTVSTPKSGCVGPGPLTGVIADASTETATDITNLNATGYTAIVLSANGVPIWNNANPVTISAPGCAFPNANWSYSIYGRRDVAAIPPQDVYGNSTQDRGTMPALDTFPSGSPYAGLTRPDMPRTVRWAAFNAVDDMAQTIRNDATYGTIIYTIGLQGNETMAMDQNFMERISNDPAYKSGFDATKPQGKFILATNTAELSQAFQQIASQILRLSQ